MNGTFQVAHGFTTGQKTYNDTSLTSNKQYVYAFYQTGSPGSSPIDPSASAPVIVKTYGDVTSMTTPNVDTTNVTLHFTLTNSMDVSATAYLYQFSQPDVSHGTSFSTPITILNGSYSRTLITSFTTGPGKVGNPTINTTFLPSPFEE